MLSDYVTQLSNMYKFWLKYPLRPSYFDVRLFGDFHIFKINILAILHMHAVDINIMNSIKTIIVERFWRFCCYLLNSQYTQLKVYCRNMLCP